MNWKIAFHCLAAVFVAAGIIAAVVPSRNKVVLVIVFTVVVAAFEIGAQFIKTVKPPQLVYSIKLLNSNYEPGVEVDGFEWQAGFRRYSFELHNKTGTSDADDVRLAFMFPGGLVGHKVLSQSGCEGISFGIRPTSMHHISQKDSMMDQIPFYQNLFYVNIVRLFPGARLLIHLILEYTVPRGVVSGGEYGLFDIEYKHKDSRSEEVQEENRFAILATGDEAKNLTIDTTKPAGLEHKFMYSMTPKQGIDIPFKRGRGIKMHMLPARLKPERPLEKGPN